MKIAKYVGIFGVFLLAAFGGLVLLSPSEIEYTVNKDINTTIDKCWQTTTDLEKASKWIAGLTSVKQIKGTELAENSSYELKFGDEQNSMVMEQTITALNPNELFSYKGVVEDFLEKTSITTFKQVDSSTTRLSSKVKLKALSFRMKLFMNNNKSFKRAEAENLDNLQELIEGS
ncbi:MAG: SRPBCC family protein [Bacteroidia bacterium]|nr:SRPBCC family protein [Bacteroidia bacterium]